MQENFEVFYQKIKLTKNQRKDAKIKYEGVCKKLHSYYYPGADYDGRTKLLIGSYGKHTNIRPPLDVDVLFVMPKGEFSRYDNYESNGQSQLLQDIRNILQEKYVTTEEIRGWGKVVLVRFSDGTHDVEILPAWENENGTFTIPNAENGGSWNEWDPRTEIKRINDSDNETGKLTRFLIRAVKKWKQVCGVRMKSFEVEGFVLMFLSSYKFDGVDYSVIIRDFFGNLVSIIDSQRKSAVETAYSRACKACRYSADGKFDGSVGEWKKIFGDDFPSMSLVKTIKSISSIRYTAASPDYSQKEQYIEDIVPVRLSGTIQIDCLVDQNGFRPSLLEKILYLRKDKRLDFIAKTDVPSPFQMKWKVRNLGEEAREKHDLRGEIANDIGQGKKTEHTKYKGEHFVECYVIKDGICVARGRKEVPIDISH